MPHLQLPHHTPGKGARHFDTRSLNEENFIASIGVYITPAAVACALRSSPCFLQAHQPCDTRLPPPAVSITDPAPPCPKPTAAGFHTLCPVALMRITGELCTSLKIVSCHTIMWYFYTFHTMTVIKFYNCLNSQFDQRSPEKCLESAPSSRLDCVCLCPCPEPSVPVRLPSEVCVGLSAP